MLRLIVATANTISDWARAVTARAVTVAATPRPVRAVTMLEWVLIATVAVILFVLLRDRLSNIFEALIQRIEGAVTSN